MKKRISIVAVSVFTVCFAMAQTKRAKLPPPPPPAPPIVEAVVTPPPPPAPPIPPAPAVAALPDDFSEFLSLNPAIKNVEWSENNLVHIYLKSGKEEVYNLDKKEEAELLEKKYGKLPVAPPPPPAPPKAPKPVKGDHKKRLS
jgi:hypothetical protein